MNFKNVLSSSKASSSGERTGQLSPKLMSSDVIREAKQWTSRTTVTTRRPSTPKDGNRELFGNRRGSSSRPPSAFSLSSHHFDPTDPESRPNSGTPFSVKLTPLTKAPSVPANAEPVISKPHIPMPPSVNKHDLSRRSQSRSMLARKVTNSQKSPMKAFHPDFSQPKIKTPTSSPKPLRSVHSAGERSPATDVSSSFALSSRMVPVPVHGQQKDNLIYTKPRSASAININLTQLYDNSELPMREDNQNSASSSSSAGSLDQLSITKRKKSGGAIQNTQEETADQAKYWNQNILPLLEALEDTGQEKELVYKVCVQLYNALNKGNCMETMSGRRRTSLLSTLFKQLNGASSSIHLACARIILAMRVRRQNLNSVCKMLFKISREKKLDGGFIENHLLERMLELISCFQNPLEAYETFVYLTGTVKFLSENKDVAMELADKGCILSLVNLIYNMMTALRECSYQKKDKLRATDILIQATAVLRNMADLDRDSFIGSDIFQHLFHMLDALVLDENLTLNVSRLLSKLTMYSNIHGEIFSYTNWPDSVLNALVIHKMSSSIIVRMCFALGNITAKDEASRIAIFNAKIGGNDTHEIISYRIALNNVLACYIKKFLRKDVTANDAGSLDTTPTDEAIDQNLDVVNKAVRVIANLSINEHVGGEIASDQSCMNHIKMILQHIQISDSEELLINTLTTLNNLSYYSCDTSCVINSRLEITNLLMKIIIGESMTCVTEAARVFGNISQYSDVRELLHKNQVDLIMVALLDSGKWQVVYSACGVLINMTADEVNRKCLLQEGIVMKLLDVLKDFSPTQWRLGGVACQLLWNLCKSVDSPASTCLSSDEGDMLLEILHAYLMDQAPLKLLDTSTWEQEMQEYIIQTWKHDFCPFADRLYKKISLYHSQLEPLNSENVDG